MLSMVYVYMQQQGEKGWKERLYCLHGDKYEEVWLV